MAQRLLFIPVSSPKGIGEYMRSVTIAQMMLCRQPNLDIRFILNEQAPYQRSCPFKTFLCPSSPTLHNNLVNSFIEELEPDIVVFDASGRVSQFKTCKKMGASVIFICQHNKKLRKGLSFRRLRHTDDIWIVQPDFCVQSLSLWSQWKISIMGKKRPKAIGPIFSKPSAKELAEVLEKFKLEANKYILVNAGSGGHIVEGLVAAKEFANAAMQINADVGEKVIIVYGPNYPDTIAGDPNCIHVPAIDSTSFNALLSQAKIALLAGGSALFQGISYGTKIVSCAVSKDQKERINRCAEMDLIRKTPLDVKSMVENVKKCLNSDWNIDAEQVRSGLDMACNEMEKILDGRSK